MSPPRVYAAVWMLGLLLSLMGCRPFQSTTQYCTEAPCGVGLECVEGVCIPPLPQPDPPPPCTAIEECAIDGSSDGRDCIEGECVWVECVQDQQCGTRICDDGACVDRELCVGDEDCKDGRVCIDGTCRSPCVADEDCAQGVLGAICTDGRCEQTCIVDFLCFGGICEDGVCEESECAADEDCPGENQACNTGRCEGFTPCGEDDDCFDADFLCNELGRCEARPACVIDNECGGNFLCLGNVCRPATTCASGADCAADEDCIGGRCVAEPVCRSNADCSGSSVCSGGSCFDPPSVNPDLIVVDSAHGSCDADGSGACELVLYLGEVAVVEVATFNATHQLVTGTFAAEASAAVITVDEDGHRVAITASSAGTASLVIDDANGAELHSALTVRVIDTSGADPLRVLVIDGDTGAPIPTASVNAGDQVGVTDANGLASFAVSPGPDALGVTGLTVSVAGRIGVVVLGLAVAGNLRVVLPRSAPPEGEAAGASGQVISTGDEVGPVGYGVGILGQASIYDASVTTLFGPAYSGDLTAPLVGAIAVDLPAAVQLEAFLPFTTENSVVRDRVYGTTTAGRRSLTGFELRTEVGSLLGDVLGATPIDLAMNLATNAEGMDVELVELGLVSSLPLVADSDDLDGDGDTSDLRPDFAQLPFAELTPSRRPAERVGLLVNSAPATARGRLFVIGGLDVAGLGFVPTGMATLGGEALVSEQLRVAQPSPEMSAGARQVRVEAVFDEGVQQGSSLYWTGSTFEESLDLGAFLPPPDGSFVIEDVPAPGGRMLVLASSAGATTYAARIVSLAGEHLVIVPSTSAGGRSVPLPAAVNGAVAVIETTALRRAGGSQEAATSTLIVAGSGPLGDVRDGAQAVAFFVE